MTKATIEIRTRLHDGIYRSLGGGQTRCSASFTVGQRNWTAAAFALRQERNDNKRSFGNVGAGRSWAVLVDGDEEIDITGPLHFHLDEIEMEDACPRNDKRQPTVRQLAPKTVSDIRDTAEHYQTIMAQIAKEAEEQED